MGGEAAGARAGEYQAVVEIVRTEVANQLTSMGVVSREDVARLEARLDDLARRLRTAASTPARRAAKKTASKRTATSTSKRGAMVKKARR